MTSLLGNAHANTIVMLIPVMAVGLITYGPRPCNQCNNIKLELRPTPSAADPIMRIVDALVPAGRTPLTSAVEQAANVLDYRAKPGVRDFDSDCPQRNYVAAY